MIATNYMLLLPNTVATLLAVTTTIIILRSVSASLAHTPPQTNAQCEPISVPICTDMPYSQTRMPNRLGHARQEEAGLAAIHYTPLVKMNCSADLRHFVCLVMMPRCEDDDDGAERERPPCRSMCESARRCEPVMRSFGLAWPEELECAGFPEGGEAGGDEEGECVESKENSVGSEVGSKSKSKSTQGHLAGNSTAASSKVSDGRKNAGGGSRAAAATTVFARHIRFVCPVQLKTPPAMGYALRVGGKEEKNCGAPCHAMFFMENERTVLRYWVASWAAICCASCLFTLLTFLIDPSRFRYPERAIVYLAFCYLIVGCAFVAGLGVGDSVACRQPFVAPVRLRGLQMVSTITQGHRQSAPCTVLFMALYFCCMAAFAWWTCLTLAWYLTAGLKWGHEAIESRAHMFHVFAWTLPALQTICVLALGKVEGDVLSGVCFVGHLDARALGWFVLLPLCAYLALGGAFLLAGFISLFRIRRVMLADGSRTDKLERLMARIGFFSALFVLPAAGLIGCLAYEYRNHEAWMMRWHREMCRVFSIPCPNGAPEAAGGTAIDSDADAPLLAVFMLKYVCSMLVGVTSAVWLVSGKTMASWRRFVERLRGDGGRDDGAGASSDRVVTTVASVAAKQQMRMKKTNGGVEVDGRDVGRQVASRGKVGDQVTAYV